MKIEREGKTSGVRIEHGRNKMVIQSGFNK